MVPANLLDVQFRRAQYGLRTQHSTVLADPFEPQLSAVKLLRPRDELISGATRALSRVKAITMETPLDGRLILIVEGEVLVAMDLQTILEEQGAETVTAYSVAEALVAVKSPSLSAAVIDHALGDGDSTQLCKVLAERHIPFVCSSAIDHIFGPCAEGRNLGKPIVHSQLVAAVSALLAETSATSM